MGLHLWYLEILFLFSLLTLPLFSYNKREITQRFSSWVASLVKIPGGIFLLVVLLELISPRPLKRTKGTYSR
jgi:hypothetical protein